jgi:type II restriction enzyme
LRYIDHLFKSRRIKPAEFIKEFFETLTPGVIPREQFIDWKRINAKCKEFEDVIEYFQGISSMGAKPLQAEIQDSLLAADDPAHLISGSFEILGHTNDYYVSDVDNLEFGEIAKKIKNGSEKVAASIAQLLLDLGLKNIILRDPQSAFMGVQVGLESNRRKSVGGGVFNQWVSQLLESTCGLLGGDYELRPELRIEYKDSRNAKTVDFGIMHKGKPRIGVEVNFYTTSGSKPSEIKRAYENVNRELNGVGVELVWITDGAGYFKMKKSLEEAFRIHPNTYNYEMARRYLKEDIYEFLK